jgi:hypothetical protein
MEEPEFPFITKYGIKKHLTSSLFYDIMIVVERGCKYGSN